MRQSIQIRHFFRSVLFPLPLARIVSQNVYPINKPNNSIDELIEYGSIKHLLG